MLPVVGPVGGALDHFLKAKHGSKASLACVRCGAQILRVVYGMVRRPGCKSNQNQWKSNETNANFIMFFAMIIQWPHYHASLANDRGCSGKTRGCGGSVGGLVSGAPGGLGESGERVVVYSVLRLRHLSFNSAPATPQQDPSDTHKQSRNQSRLMC